jgi:hypothetical protein
MIKERTMLTSATITPTRPDLRHEAELLLCCARTQLDSTRRTRLKQLPDRLVDWPYLLRMAERNGVLPLLYWNLKVCCPEAVPPDILERLRDRYERNARYNRVLTTELLKLVQLLEANGIPTVAYKGPSLAALAYGNLALRQFSDLDIVVEEQLVARAKTLLRSEGYREQKQPAVGQNRLDSIATWQAILVRRADQIVVGLHWRVAPDHFFPIPPEIIWSDLRQTWLDGTSIRSFPPETLLLILCVHGTIHLWSRLGWICDIAELIRVQPDLNWDRLIWQAGQLVLLRPLLVALYLAHDLLELALPRAIQQEILADPGVIPLAGRMSEQLFAEPDGAAESSHAAESAPPPGPLEQPAAEIQHLLQLMDSPGHRKAADRPVVTIPLKPPFLEALHRPARLVKDYGLSLIKQLSR